MTGTTPTPQRLPSPATSPTTSTSRTPTPAAGTPTRAPPRSTKSPAPHPRPPRPHPKTHPPAPPHPRFSARRAPLVSPALRASYALIGSQLQPGPHGPLTGIHVILSNGGDDTERQHQEAQILQTGLFYSAARFRIIEGSPAPAEWLPGFETERPH